MAEDTEVPVDDATIAKEIPVENNDAAEETDETRIHEIGSTMLEDETMPTYLSLDSTSSLKPDDGKVQPQSTNVDNDVEDDKSVYEVSSGDEEEENDRDFYDIEDGDREDEEGYDTDDTHIIESSDRRKYHESGEIDDESTGDDEEDDDEEDEEDSDGDIEPEMFERSSDDYVFRPTPITVESNHEKRSKSLQDLSSPKGKKFNNSRRQMFMHPNHVPGKVKRYIEDMREQSKQSAQRKSTEMINVIHKQNPSNPKGELLEEKADLRLNPQCKSLKEYATCGMKNVDYSFPPESGITLETVVNGTEMDNVDSLKTSNHREIHLEEMQVDENNADMVNCKREKPNGTVDYTSKVESKRVQNDEVPRASLPPLDILPNGQQNPGAILNVQTLSYDDYMKGNFEENLPKTDEIPKIITPSEPMETAQIIPVPVPKYNELHFQSDVTATSELNFLKSALKEKTSDYSSLKIQHQKVIHENSQLKSEAIAYTEIINDYQLFEKENYELKKEIAELKKAMAKQKEENKPKEMKEASVQTEKVQRLLPTSTTTHLLEVNKLSEPNKLSASVASTLSSIEQWTDSEWSPAVSLKPPNIDTILNSGDSMLIGGSKKSTQTSSHALMTTRKILQTLASMTPGIPMPGQSKEPVSPLVTVGQGSRKRKATESLGSCAQPFKIPTMSTNDPHNKQFNSTSDTDAARRGDPAGQKENGEGDQQRTDDGIDGDDVKCYVWDEEEDRSCLIQAPVGQDTSKPKAKGHLRECGPYLLGNIEVRISEANGTLNIWGKEVSQKSSSKGSDCPDDETVDRINESCWPETPRENFNTNPFTCSTNKKSKTPTSVRANLARQLRTLLNRSPSPVDVPVENTATSHLSTAPELCQHGSNKYEQCHDTKHLFVPTCNNIVESRIKQSCCIQKSDCGCRRHCGTCVENSHHSCNLIHKMSNECSAGSSHNHNYQVKHNCHNYSPAEDCKHNVSCQHRLSGHYEIQEPCVHVAKRRKCNSSEINDCHHRAESVYYQGLDRGNDMNNYGSGCPEEGETLRHFEKSTETPEAKRHRIRNKRVRGIVELLKSCGDCRHSSTASFDNNDIPETEFTNTRSVPNSNRPSTSAGFKQTYNSGRQKGCNSCDKSTAAGLIELKNNPPTLSAAEYEAALDGMHQEISKLHAKTDAIRELLLQVFNPDKN